MTGPILTCSRLALAGAMLWSQAALAQDLPTSEPVAGETPAAAQDAPGSGTDIVVTGSRIARDGYQAPTPLTVLSAQDIQATAPANVADYLNRIPSVVGSATPANSNLNISAGTFGVNAINLRSLGANRTLVLLDGQRSVGSTLTGLVDVNTFPQGLIKGVEIVTGGASAAYGSDAVSGVVNFQLDREYKGFKGSAEYGITDYGDAPNYRVGLTAGAEFASGRGHVLLSGEVAVREGLHGVPRKWNDRGWYIINNPAYAAGNGQPERLVTSGAGLSNATPGGIITNTALKGTYFGPGGSVNRFNYGTTLDPWMIGGDWQYTQVNGFQSLDPAENRKNIFGRVSYEIADWLNVYAQASYARSRNVGQLGVQLNQGNITIRSDNAFIPESVRQELAARNISQFSLGSTNADLPIRTNDTLRKVQRYVIGADGKFSLFGRNARWDAYYQKGIADTREMAVGITNNARLALAQDAVFAPAGNALGVPAGTIVCRSSLADTTNGCVPLNRMGIGVASPEALAYVLGNPFRTQRFEQEVAAANLSFDAFRLPAGAVSVAIGGEHRREKVSGAVEPQYQSGWFVGNYLPTFGHYSVTEGYIEVLVPVVKGLDLNGAVRGTDYSTSGYVTTWKAGATFEPIPGIRFRGTRSRDIRAPNLGELFTAGSTRINVLIDRGASVQFAGTTTGNLALEPEKADQWGVGVVLQPEQWVPGFAFSVDYYDIKIKDAIGSVAAQTIVDRCNEGVEAFCAAVVRGPNAYGNNLQVFESPFNFATQRARGLDFETSYRTSLGAGELVLRGMATRYLENYTNNGIDAPTDTVGSNQATPAGTPKWLYRVMGTYSRGPFTFNLIGRGVSDGVYDTSFIECTSGCPVSTVTNRTINDNHIDGAFYVDVSASHDFTLGSATMQLFANVTNLLDKDPPVAASGPAGSAYATPATNQSIYDLLGRTYRIGLRFRM